MRKFVLIASASFVLGVGVGLPTGWLQALREQQAITDRQLALSNRIEGFTPSCEQLTKLGTYGPLTFGQDTIVLVVEKGVFHVFGFNNSPGTPPSTSWWGADRSSLMEQACQSK